MYALDRTIASRSGDAAILVGRLLIGLVFIPGGFRKLMDPAPFAKYLESNGVPMSSFLAPIGGAVEFFGGLAVLLGFHMRVSALLMIAFTLAATWIAHRYWTFADPAQNRLQYQAFMKNLGIVAGLLFLMVAGPGRFSLDRWFGAKH